MLSIQYYPFGCQNGQQNRQHTSLRILLDSPRSLLPMQSVHAVHFTLRSSFHAHYSTAASVNIIKRIKVGGRWKFFAIPHTEIRGLGLEGTTVSPCNYPDETRYHCDSESDQKLDGTSARVY
jgi:hypothetical protein